MTTHSIATKLGAPAKLSTPAKPIRRPTVARLTPLLHRRGWLRKDLDVAIALNTNGTVGVGRSVRQAQTVHGSTQLKVYTRLFAKRCETVEDQRVAIASDVRIARDGAALDPRCIVISRNGRRLHGRTKI